MNRRFHNIPSVPFLSVILLIGVSMMGCVGRNRDAVLKFQTEETFTNSRLTKSVGKDNPLVAEALEWLGTPYGYGRQDKGVATDCSGFVMQVYLKVMEIKLPRNSAAQYDFCQKIDKSCVRPGDLVFFAIGQDTLKVSHVGLMIDKENFVHSSSSKGVIISQMCSPYWNRTFRSFGRPRS